MGRISQSLINQQWIKVPISFPGLDDEDTQEMPLNISASVAGHRIAWVHVDGGSGVKVMYEHCFARIQKEIQNKLDEDACPLMGFSGEVVEPLSSLNLPLTPQGWRTDQNGSSTILRGKAPVKVQHHPRETWDESTYSHSINGPRLPPIPHTKVSGYHSIPGRNRSRSGGQGQIREKPKECCRVYSQRRVSRAYNKNWGTVR